MANPKTPIPDTLEILAQKSLLPTHLSSAEARAALSVSIRRNSVWSARTTNVIYVQALRDAVARLIKGGRGNDYANVRADLKDLIVSLGYTPEKGFPGDEALGIPPAAPGSMRDLSSRKRIEFVVNTQLSLVRHASQRARGLSAIDGHPYWELIRIETRRVPRGSAESTTFGWQKRWMIAGGPILPSGRLVAHKLDPVWDRLGDSRIFDDGLDVPHPPFCFGSGMGWKDVGFTEGRDLMVPPPSVRKPTLDPASTLPRPVMSIKGLDDAVRDELLAVVEAENAEKPGYIRLRELMERNAAVAQAEYEARGKITPEKVAAAKAKYEAQEKLDAAKKGRSGT